MPPASLGLLMDSHTWVISLRWDLVNFLAELTLILPNFISQIDGISVVYHQD
jgi:hypothetical protein